MNNFKIIDPLRPTKVLNTGILHICGAGGECVITIDMCSGKVTLAPNLNLDEASQKFWAAIEKSFPMKELVND
jgi:hypothetical protein